MAPRSLPPAKKRRTEHNSAIIERTKALESNLTQAVEKNESLNPLADLLDIVRSSQNPAEALKTIYSAYRVFVVIISSGKLGLGSDDAAKLVKTWLLARLNDYVDFLCGLLKDDDKTLRTSALQILMSLQKHLSTSYSNSPSSSKRSQPQFHVSHFRKIISALLLCPSSQRPTNKANDDLLLDVDVANLFHETWFSVHDDVRWFFLRDSTTLLNAHPKHPTLPTNLLAILEHLTTFPTEPSELNAWWVLELGVTPPKPKHRSDGENSDPENERAVSKSEDGDENDDWRKFFEDEPPPPETPKSKISSVRLHQMSIHQSLHSLASHQAMFTRTWLALLPRLSGTEDAENLAVRVLNIMHRGILPHITRPILVMDWVSACVDYGGSVGLLALNALFILMKEYNLDYPSFYTRLYAFLDRDVLHLRHRARFFRMSELFLSSTHLPATLLASFVKRLSRLSLTAPPAAIVIVIPFVYNILKRHPALMVMIHNTNVGDQSIDPFLPDEPNPTLTRALESSLWELVSHRSHYHPTVSTLCKVFAEPFTKPSYPLEDFLDHTFATLFDAEVNRKIKKDPALAMDLPKNFVSFPSQSFNPTGESELAGKVDLISELWCFE